MDFNYIKTFAMSALVAGALAASLPAMAVTPVSVAPPATDPVESLQDFTFTFAESATVAWAVTGTESAPTLKMIGEGDGLFTTIAGPSSLKAEGNQLFLNFPTEADKAGEYKLTLPAGSYTVDGVAGDEYTSTYTVTGALPPYTVEPAADILSEIQNIKITFNDAKKLTLAEELGTENTPVLFLVTEEGERERRGTFFPSIAGSNNMLLTMRTPVYEEGEYVVLVPGSTYFLDGNAGENIELSYKVVAPSYPDIDLSVEPATGIVETIETIEVTFGGVELVEWTVTGTENAPYLADSEGNRCATFSKLDGQGNMLSLAMWAEPYDVKGMYEVVIPEGSYKLQGIYHGMPGKEIRLNYQLLGVGGVTVDPSVDVLNEIQNIKITFNDAKEVTIAEDLETENTPVLYLVTEEGKRERRGTFFPSVAGSNNMLLTMRSPIYEEGEYVVVVPGSTYFLDGNAGENIELNYTVVAPAYPDIELSVNPATDVVESIETIELTFGGVDIVEWVVTGTENSPYLLDVNTNTRMGTFAKLGGQGNMLSMGFYTEFDVKGEYKVIIPEGSYVLQGIYHGMPGKEITLNYEVLGPTGITVEPAVNTLNEIQNIKITFNEAKEVTLAEELGTDNTPVLYLIPEEGERERRGTFFPEVVGGNNMLLTMRSPVYEEGEYVVVVPGSTYFLDGEKGEDIELFYTVVAPSYPDVELSVDPATDKVETLDTIEVTFGGVELVEWAVGEDTELAPYLVDLQGNRWATFAKLGGLGNMLSLALYAEPFDVKGEYKVVIPEGSYVFQGIYHGMPGKEITLNFEVLGLSGYTVEPAVNVLNEIQNIKITFHEAKEVTLAEELGTLNTPYLEFVTEEGERERRGTFFPSVAGNNLMLTMNSPIYEEGEYNVIIPGTTYFLDGNEGEDIVLNYTVVEPAYPDVELSVLPATDVVETLETIEVTFGGVDIVEWVVTGTENAPYMINQDGDRMGTFTELGGLGNMLSLGFKSEFDVKGEYTVIIPEGSYVLQGIYHGMPGKEIKLNFEVLGLSGFSVEPAVDVLNEIQNIKITFHEAKVVTIPENIEDNNSPKLFRVDEENNRVAAGTFSMGVAGNNLFLTMESPVAEEGEYVIVIPGASYFLDGNEGSDIELFYTVIPGEKPYAYTVDPAEGEVEELNTFAITFTDAAKAEWKLEAIEMDRSLCPNIQEGEDVKENLINLTSEGNVLYAAPYGGYGWTEKGYYVVTIPAGSYTVDGQDGEQIVLTYIVSGSVGIDAIFGDQQNLDVYDMNGRVIMRNVDASALKTLRGMYIIGGKKYILR